jgi:hypothetical protein
LSEERQIKFAPSMYQRLVERSHETGISVAEQVRRAVANDLDPKPVSVDWAMVGTDVVKARYLDKSRCGNWDEAMADERWFVLSKHTAQYLDVQDGDIVVGAMGDSMEQAGIFDGSLVVMRPVAGYRQPRTGQIVLAQRVGADGACESLIKYWHTGEPPRLTDGGGNTVEIPEETVKIEAVAIAKGVITPL